MNLNKIIIGILLCVVIASCTKKERNVTVTGNIHFFTEYDYFEVVSGQGDSVIHSISLHPDSTVHPFSFTLSDPEDLVYSLRFTLYREGYEYVKFKPDDKGDEIFLDLYSSDESTKNHVSGSKATAEIWRKDHIRDSLYGHEIAQLYSIGAHSRSRDLYAEMLEWQLQDMEKNISIPNYHDLVDVAWAVHYGTPISMDRVKSVSDLYRKKYPGHHYTKVVEEIYNRPKE